MVFLTYPLMVAIQLASASIGRVTGKGLTENFARILPGWMVKALVLSLVTANVINFGADLNAMGDAVAVVVGGHQALYALAFGRVSLVVLRIRSS